MRPALRIPALVVLLLGSPALSGAARGPALTIRGVARLTSGDPVFKARVVATTGKRTSTTTDDSGRFTLDLPLPDPAALARDSTTLQVWVTARNLHFSAPDGQLSLGLTLKLERGADGVSRVVAFSNDERLAQRAAHAVVSGSHATLDSVVFAGGLGESTSDPFPPQVPLRVEAPIGAGTSAASGPTHASGPSPAPAAAGVASAGAVAGAAAAAGGAAGHAATPSGPSAPRSAPAPATLADSLRYNRTPEDAMSHPATAGATGVAGAAGGATSKSAAGATGTVHSGGTAHGAPTAGAPADTSHCACRIAGTIETAGGPLREPLRLIVSLEGLSAPNDTVTLDMGSPRAFDLRDVPCGARRLVVRPASGKMRFNVLDPDHTLPIACQHERRAQPRVVLVPR
jgi:hypothetical protein